jgi:signal peptidase I
VRRSFALPILALAACTSDDGRSFTIPSCSMAPTLVVGDSVTLDEDAVPSVDDVVVFENPVDDVDRQGDDGACLP